MSRLTEIRETPGTDYTYVNAEVGGKRVTIANDENGRGPAYVLDLKGDNELGYWNNTTNAWESTSSSADAQWFNNNSKQLIKAAPEIRSANREKTVARSNPNFRNTIEDGGGGKAIPPPFKLRTSESARFTRAQQGGRVGKTLVYPLDHARGDFDFIKIFPIEYVPTLGAGSFGATSAQNISERTFRFGTRFKQRFGQRKKVVGSTVFLPMVPGISESNAVAWGEDRLTPVQMAAGRVAANSINATATEGAGAGFNALLTGAKDGTNEALKDPTLRSFLISYFAGQAVGANILGRAGIVVNPNLEVLFQGPQLRSFQYNFQFTPREEREAEVIKEIIKLFKKTMAPRRSSSQLFLDVPAVYQIEYLMKGQVEHPFLNKIKPCALSQFNVDYTPGGSYMTYDDGSMTQYNVSMQFRELEPIYNDDVDMNSRTMSY